ncbi:hypothetical protein C0585_04095 [Candidatus Woesearchaeota archaeon]|nr:MAG: hypothetical protein C0585_04095 [Candidatus Woesearchaeota archaeon]
MTYTKLTLETMDLIAYSNIKSSLDSFAKRADRVVKPLASSTYERLTKGQNISENSGIIADYRFEDKDKARTLTEGIKEFKARFPEYGSKLQDIIDETRKTKKRYVNFGLEQGFELPNEIYIDALRKIGIQESRLKSTYNSVMAMSDVLAKKKKEGLTELLIK